MKHCIISSVVAACLAITAHAVPGNVPASYPTDTLKSWPPAPAEALKNMIAKNAHKSNYAVFDADNTIWKNDISEAAIAYLENRGIITRETMDPSLKLIDFKDDASNTESLHSYYTRLCEIDVMICYPWIAQVFSGLTLRELKCHIDDLFALNVTIPTTKWKDGAAVQCEVEPPKVFTKQVELINELQNNGIEVYIVSASNEEIVRMVVSDPKYGYNVKPENVLGVATILKCAKTGELTSSRKQISAGTYNETANLDLELSTHLWTPATWYAGKWAAILTYVDMWKKPVLAAGDTPGSDTYMHFNVDMDKGGLRLWVKQSPESYEELQTLIAESVQGQKENGLAVTADKCWVYVRPHELL
ncbi:uncharacterized protein L3040_006179 [Drepanopeziza brunnea f. sp. 'multigermtubi']|uniref:Phosphorylcholine phosphatase n=1 Tax=Marssonina brunnea f. sp. multigermtubi (strain MB_m1) TaxID=1072389 RepID=K1X8M3_MARBU|nr:phosphorylcholine phosphatase [Drepanopeziza brunnea f. sp. 'multigermtubi' MB_m1]EKD21441.1 phosphorylcholine phosphatase [Drepanopeziza brunnea f. sp. 'multigermtubi' MB_m1]KAJ5040525.1 hypothetical protein L3040_006179 [Drepanopeziza brunnea f. sp. 'multigermtubi']